MTASADTAKAQDATEAKADDAPAKKSTGRRAARRKDDDTEDLEDPETLRATLTDHMAEADA